MGCIPFFMLLAVGMSTTVGVRVNKTHPAIPSPSAGNLTESPSNATSRRGRHIQEIVELPPPSKKIKRQIIKIPPSVSKVKLVQPSLNPRHHVAPHPFGRRPAVFRRGGHWRPPNKNYQQESEFGADPFPFDPKKVKRNLKKPMRKETDQEEFQREEEHDFEYEEGKHRPRRVKKQKSVVKIKRKKPKQSALSEYLVNFEGEGLPSQEGGFDGTRLHYEGLDQSFQGYDSAGSSVHMMQVPPPNLLLDDVPLKPPADEQPFDDDYMTGLTVKKLPTKGRQILSLFSQQYTTHNPQVTTNFGLGRPNVGQYGVEGSFVDATPFEPPHRGHHVQPVEAASNQVAAAIPVGTPGIQVIQPPQFRDVTVSHPSHPSRLVSPLSQQRVETTSQKATIRDILEQDCPSFDAKGFCDSPPRYPMLQIRSMMKKCANLMEVMNTQPHEEPHESYAFAKRSDNNEGRDNKSISLDLGLESQSWSRSGNVELTACTSDLELMEPGYAKEVNSERWFVIVQHPDTTIQRIATDTCRNPGKPCGGLSELKCSKINHLSSKSTRCVQRYTYQRLISWDPESPEECPRMRVFKFPSACVCHLGVL